MRRFKTIDGRDNVIYSHGQWLMETSSEGTCTFISAAYARTLIREPTWRSLDLTCDPDCECMKVGLTLPVWFLKDSDRA